jgi:hypothetical protein
MKKENKFKIIGLALLALLATGVTGTMAYAAKVETAQFTGDISYVAAPHVDATIDAYIDDVAVDLNGSASGTSLVIKKEDATSTVYDTSAFSTALSTALTGNTGSNGGYVEPKSSCVVAFVVTNTSLLNYNLTYSVSHTETSLVNITETYDAASAVESALLAPSAACEKVKYNIAVTDNTISASGSFAWTVSLVASNH